MGVGGRATTTGLEAGLKIVARFRVASARRWRFFKMEDLVFSTCVDGSLGGPGGDFEGLRTWLGPSYRPSSALAIVVRWEEGPGCARGPTRKPEVAGAPVMRLDVFL